ncbi:MAG: hypothetical protein JW966_11780 [Anaerolineae bacterium]|nr:hypothetical protein [Anaerolineae bacterium]
MGRTHAEPLFDSNKSNRSSEESVESPGSGQRPTDPREQPQHRVTHSSPASSFKPITRTLTTTDLGLPADYKDRYIPTTTDLRRAAVRALDDKIALLVMHQDNASVIIENLDQISEIVLAALEISGEHQIRAIRLGLALELRFWLKRDKLAGWLKLITSLLNAAIDTGHYDLLSEIYRAWSIYLFVTGNNPNSQAALRIALEEAETSGRRDLELLARTERLNITIPDLSLDEVQTGAQHILDEAQRLKFTYIQARVFMLLARAYDNAMMHGQAFAYAQQALVLAQREHFAGIMWTSVGLMLNSLQACQNQACLYYNQLLTYLETLAQTYNSPWLETWIYHTRAVEHYHAKSYDSARDYILRAYKAAHTTYNRPARCRAKHMLGLIQTKRRCWQMAERHLRHAVRDYEHTGQRVLKYHARHALAYISVEQGDFERGIRHMQQVLADVQSLPEDAARESLTALLENDINEIREKLSGTSEPID